MSKKVLSPYCPPQTLDYLTFSAEGNLLIKTSFDTDDGTEIIGGGEDELDLD